MNRLVNHNPLIQRDDADGALVVAGGGGVGSSRNAVVLFVDKTKAYSAAATNALLSGCSSL